MTHQLVSLPLNELWFSSRKPVIPSNAHRGGIHVGILAPRIGSVSHRVGPSPGEMAGLQCAEG